MSSKEQESLSQVKQIWWTHLRKWLSHQSKKSKVVKNWTITADKDPWCTHRNKEQES